MVRESPLCVGLHVQIIVQVYIDTTIHNICCVNVLFLEPVRDTTIYLVSSSFSYEHLLNGERLEAEVFNS